jgi:hypothetical protein
MAQDTQSRAISKEENNDCQQSGLVDLSLLTLSSGEKEPLSQQKDVNFFSFFGAWLEIHNLVERLLEFSRAESSGIGHSRESTFISHFSLKTFPLYCKLQG